MLRILQRRLLCDRLSARREQVALTLGLIRVIRRRRRRFRQRDPASKRQRLRLGHSPELEAG